MNIISFENETIKLNSGILEENFGKMSFASIITEQGTFVKVSKSEDKYSFEYSPWTFQDVQSFDSDGGRKVFYLGKSPFGSQAESFLSLMEGEQAFAAAFRVIEILTDAALNKTDLPYSGAGSIILDMGDENNFSALFLPENLYKGSVAGLSDEEKARQINLWINPTLSGNQALRFARSNLAYKVLTEKFPFPSVDVIERNADILDKKYIPVELCIPEINQKLGEKINSELELNSATVNIPGKKERKTLVAKINEDRVKNETDAQKAARLQESFLKAVSEFPVQEFLLAKDNTSKLSDEEISKKAADYMTKKTSRVNAKRKIRRNTGVIITVIVAALILAVIIGNNIKADGLSKTTKGLTAEETTEAFYQAINNLDTVFITDCAKGRTASAYGNVISQMYVVSKNRMAYSHDRGIQNPGAYFTDLLDETRITEGGLYGISDLTINGNPKDMDLVIPVKKDKRAPITEDKGIKVYDKLTSVQTVQFYMVHSEANDLFCEKQTETVTLTFKKDRWIITDISSQAEPVKIQSSDFFKDYFAVMDLTGSDPVASCRILKSLYPWLPSEKAFEVEAKKRIDDEMALRKTFGME